MDFIFYHISPLPEVILVEGKRYIDPRGFFTMTYRKSAFVEAGIKDNFQQDNYSHSVKGVIRGLHYQKTPKAQAKLVMVLHGEVFDVAVDLRKNSPTLGHWVGCTLTAARPQMLYIPKGFAHGFCVLSNEVDLLYKVTEEYSPDDERGVIWNDQSINIPWPIINIKDIIVSEKDAALPSFKDAELIV